MSTYTHDYTAEYLSLFKRSGAKIQITNAAVLNKIGAAPASHVDVHASDTDYGHVLASSSLPLANGTAAVGTSLAYARADHVHPAQDASHATDADFAKALKNPFMLYLEGAVTAEDRVDGNTDVHLRVIKLDANALEGLISLDNLPVGTDANSIAAGNHTHDYSSVYAPYSHDHTSSDITDLSTVLSGYSPSGHGHNYAGSSSDGGAANSVKEKLKIKLNSETATEYNGSTEREIDITASAIGAATSGHNHDSSYSAIGHNHNGVYAPYSHEHPYLPLAGGVMGFVNNSLGKGPVSFDIAESRGRYYGVYHGAIAYDDTDSNAIVLKTKIANEKLSNTNNSQFLQIIITGFDREGGGKTINCSIGLHFNASGIIANKSSWSTCGSVAVTSVGYYLQTDVYYDYGNTSITRNQGYAFVIKLASTGNYRYNVDVVCDELATRGSEFVKNITDIGNTTAYAYPNGMLYGWIADDAADSGKTVTSLSNKVNYPVLSHEHALTNITSAFPYAGVMISTGATSQPTSKAGSANRQFLKYTKNNNDDPGTYGFSTISKDDLPNISSLNSGAIAAGHLLVSASNNGAEWLPPGNNGEFLQQTSLGLVFKPIHDRTMLTLTSSHTSSNPATFTHTAGTDQTVYLILPTDSTATTSFYVKIQSPNSEWAGDKIQFIVVNDVTTSPDTYNPIVYFKKTTSNDKYIGDYGYDSAGIAESALSIASGFMLNLYCITVGASTIWRAQRMAEIGFDQD